MRQNLRVVKEMVGLEGIDVELEGTGCGHWVLPIVLVA